LINLEDRTDTDPDDDTMRAIIDLRNDLTRTARVVRSQRDVAGMLARATYEQLPERLTPYLRDVYDHLLRVHDQIEGARDQILAVRDLYLALVNNRLSDIMRVLTVIATIMMPLSLVAGIWGMNVGGLPGAQSRLGFWVVCVAMGLLATAMLVWFRRRRWL
jgi:magnesium transporter